LKLVEDELGVALKEGKLVGAELAQTINALSNLNYMPGRTFMSTFKTTVLEQREVIDLSTMAVVMWSVSALNVPGLKVFMGKMIDAVISRLEDIDVERPSPLEQEQEPTLRASAYYSSFAEDVPTIGDEKLEPPMVMCMRQLVQTARFLTTIKSPISGPRFRRFVSLLSEMWGQVQQEKFEVRSSAFHMEVQGVIENQLGLACASEVRACLLGLPVCLCLCVSCAALCLSPSPPSCGPRTGCDDIAHVNLGGSAWRGVDGGLAYLGTQVEDEAYTLDLVIQPGDGGLPVAVEVDGPHHFFRNHPEEPMGFTKFKHRMLTAQTDRWRSVVSVSRPEWTRVSPDAAARTACMVRKLREAGIESFPGLAGAGAGAAEGGR
jgi:hypothetical protein